MELGKEQQALKKSDKIIPIFVRGHGEESQMSMDFQQVELVWGIQGDARKIKFFIAKPV